MAPKTGVRSECEKDAWGEWWKEDPPRKKPGTRPGVSQPTAPGSELVAQTRAQRVNLGIAPAEANRKCGERGTIEERGRAVELVVEILTTQQPVLRQRPFSASACHPAGFGLIQRDVRKIREAVVVEPAIMVDVGDGQATGGIEHERRRRQQPDPPPEAGEPIDVTAQGGACRRSRGAAEEVNPLRLRLANTRRCPIGLNAEEPLRRELPVVAQVAGDGSGSQRASVSPQP